MPNLDIKVSIKDTEAFKTLLLQLQIALEALSEYSDDGIITTEGEIAQTAIHKIKDNLAEIGIELELGEGLSE